MIVQNGILTLIDTCALQIERFEEACSPMLASKALHNEFEMIVSQIMMIMN